jgi:hypothetical protein
MMMTGLSDMQEKQTAPIDLTDIASKINVAHKAYVAATKKGTKHAIEAGDLLIQAKEKLKAEVGHGHWMGWLTRNCPDVSSRTARFYMQVARNAPEMAGLANMTMEQAAKVMADAWRNLDDETDDKEPADTDDPPKPALDAAWDDATMAQKAEFIKRHLKMVKALVERVEKADEVARQRGEQPASYA